MWFTYHAASCIFPMKWTGTHRHVNAQQKLSSEKFILWCHWGNHTGSFSPRCLLLFLFHTCACTCIFPSLYPPSSLHSFACKYGPWLFLSVFFQKLPGEIRVEKPIACSQQIKEAGASSNDVTDNLPYGVQGKGKVQFGVQGWVRDVAPRISILLLLLHSKCSLSM